MSICVAEDFFAVNEYPELTFKSKKITGSGDNITVVGDLTIKDVTKEVVLKGAFAGTAVDPWGNKRAGFEANGEIDRKDFGLIGTKPWSRGERVPGRRQGQNRPGSRSCRPAVTQATLRLDNSRSLPFA